MENDTTWFALGSMRTMVVWGLAGIPIDPQEFDEFRTRLINEGHGPEVAITVACRNLNEHIRSMEYQRDPDLRSDIRAARNTLRYLQYLLLLCGRQDPLAYHSATITFNKWMENGSSLDFFTDNETSPGEANETENDEEEAEEEVNETEEQRNGARGPLEESEDPDAWIEWHYDPMDVDEEADYFREVSAEADDEAEGTEEQEENEEQNDKENVNPEE